MSDRGKAVSGLPSFDDLLCDPAEQFDVRSELLSSVLEYLAAPSSTAGLQPWVGESHRTWLYAPSSTGNTAVA